MPAAKEKTTGRRTPAAAKPNAPDDDRLIDQHERKRLVPYSDMHILRLEKAGRFPKRTRLNNGRVAWSFNEVQAWIADRLGERGGEAAR